jgi:ABC-type nitrate/sulfonate/bicarbonate transport system permease component
MAEAMDDGAATAGHAGPSAPSGWRRAVVGLVVGAVVGLTIGLLLPHEERPDER